MKTSGPPDTLALMLAGFIVLPLWSLTIAPPPSELVRALDLGNLLRLSAYWVLPLAIVAAIMRQSLSLIPLYIAELACLTGLVIASELTGAALWIVSAALVGLAILGILILNLDIVMPLKSNAGRKWRRHRRVRGNLPLRLVRMDKGKVQSFRVVLEDCSTSGLRVYGRSATLEDAGVTLEHGTQFEIHYRLGERQGSFPVRLAWSNATDRFVVMGFETVRAGGAEPVLAMLLRVQKRRKLMGRLEILWVSHPYRRAVAGLWALALVGSLVVPACSRQDFAAEAQVLPDEPLQDVQAFLPSE